MTLAKSLKDAELIYKGKRINLYKSGTKEIVDHPGAVVILAVKDDQFIMIKNYRISVDKTLWECPAGTIEPGEDPLECAKRELIEETGYQATKWTPLLNFYSTQASVTNVSIVS